MARREHRADSSRQSRKAGRREVAPAQQQHAEAGVLEQTDPTKVLEPRRPVRPVDVAEILEQDALVDITEIRMPIADRRPDRGLGGGLGQAGLDEPEAHESLGWRVHGPPHAVQRPSQCDRTTP